MAPCSLSKVKSAMTLQTQTKAILLFLFITNFLPKIVVAEFVKQTSGVPCTGENTHLVMTPDDCQRGNLELGGIKASECVRACENQDDMNKLYTVDSWTHMPKGCWQYYRHGQLFLTRYGTTEPCHPKGQGGNDGYECICWRGFV